MNEVNINGMVGISQNLHQPLLGRITCIFTNIFSHRAEQGVPLCSRFSRIAEIQRTVIDVQQLVSGFLLKLWKAINQLVCSTELPQHISPTLKALFPHGKHRVPRIRVHSKPFYCNGNFRVSV
uniref:(northern house mosquito) hypothetical protein n=1 Tax=Culex pipiens TaxID=7175 RepID=A0A8D8H9C7_CULPI